ncbi:RIP metalloprotease [Elusimicrobiota bacterium]
MISIFGYEITIFQIFGTIFGVGVLVFIHELGHFLSAKKFGIKVEQFAFGFGREIVGYTYGETRYSICMIPFGGMVKMPGEYVDDATGSPDEFMSQAWYKRLIIAFSGPFMNYLFAILLFTGIILVWGLSTTSMKPVIGDVMEGYPAFKAGLQSGDTIKKINGVEVSGWMEMAENIHKYPEQKIPFNITRNEKPMVVYVQPLKDVSTGNGVIGITPSIVKERIGFFAAITMSTRMAIFQTVFTLKYLGNKIIKWEKPDVAGPIGVIQFVAKAAKSGWESFLHLLAVISVALGLFNLLPIPLVDGGHIVMSLVEGITRKPLNKKMVQTANLAGFSFIIFIFVLATYNDLSRMGLDFTKFFK